MPIDRHIIYAWMAVYYRQVAQQLNFHSKSEGERWRLLRAHIRADGPVNDAARAAAIDRIPESERRAILGWLEARRQPNEDLDVIVHVIDVVDASTNTHRLTWHIFLGGEPKGTRDHEGSAINAALDLAAQNDRPAWLLGPNGHPLKPLTEDDRRISAGTS